MTVTTASVRTGRQDGQTPRSRGKSADRPVVVRDFPADASASDRPPPSVTVIAGGYGTDGGAMYHRVRVKDDDGNPKVNAAGKPEYRWETVLRCDVRFAVDRRAAPDPDFGEATDAEDLPEASSDVEVTLPGPDGGVTQVFRNMATSDLIKAKFLDMAGRRAYLGLNRSLTSAARSDLFRMVNELSQVRKPRDDVFYTISGWHDDRGQPFFVTGSGAIGPRGYMPEIVTKLPDRLDIYAPQDAPGGKRLLDAFDAVTDLLDAMPGRLLWPLVAARLRPLFGVWRDPADAGADYETVPIGNITGNSGGGKSGLHAATGNVIAPGLRYNTIPFKCGNSANGGATGPGMENLLYAARDLPTDWDDLDPNESEDKRAAWQSLLIRRAAGQQARLLAKRAGGNRAGKPCRAGVVLNGEPLDAQQSAENRAFNIEVGPADVKRSVLRHITGPEARGLRSELGGGVIRAIAANRPGWLARMAQARVALRPLFADGDVPGAVDRGADCFAELAATWFVTLQILRRNGMSVADARDFWRVITEGLQNAWRAHLAVIGRGSRAARALGTIQEGISAGIITLASARNPAVPPAEPRYQRGWTENNTDGSWRAPQRIHGFIDDRDGQAGDLLLLPKLATAAVRAMEAGTGGSWTGGVKTLAESLKADGAITGVAASRVGEGRLTDRPKLGNGDRPYVWRIPVARLDDDDDGPAVRDYSGPVDYSAIDHGAAIDPDSTDNGPESVQEPGAPEMPQDPKPPAQPVRAVPNGSAPSRPIHAPRPDNERAARESEWRAVAGPGTRPAAPRQSEPKRNVMPYSERFTLFAKDARKLGGRPGTDADDATIQRALDVLERAMKGYRYEAPVHLAGVQLFHWKEAKHGSIPELDRADVPALVGPELDLSATAHQVCRGFHVTGPATQDPAAWAIPGLWVVGVDVNAQLANAAQMAELGTGKPEWLSNPIDPSIIAASVSDGFLPGYVLLKNAASWPGPFRCIKPGQFITTHMAKLLTVWAKDGRCALPEIERAIVWRSHRRWLRPTARAFLDGRAALISRDDVPAKIALDVLKQAYSQFFGGMLASGPGAGSHNRTKLLRIDARDMVKGEAQFLMWLALGKTDPAPAVVKDPDAAYFIMPEPFARPDGLTFSEAPEWKPGKWKLMRDRMPCPLTEPIRDAILRDRPGMAVKRIIAAAQEHRTGGVQ